MTQVPIGLSDEHEGVVNLVNMKSYIFSGDNGEIVTEGEIPEDLMDTVLERREMMLDAVATGLDNLEGQEDFAEEFAMLAMEDEDERVDADTINKAIRLATIGLELCPVMLGSAYKNKGVQLLLDNVGNWLPSPVEVDNVAMEKGDETQKHVVDSNADDSLLALAFKLEDGRYGQLTYIRVYSGTLTKGDTIFNVRDMRKVKVGRLVRMHSDDKEEIEVAKAGDIVALFGVDCFSGDTFTDGEREWVMSSIHVPDPVISMAIQPKDSKNLNNLSKALQRFRKEDPTFQVEQDKETNETIISGMGELHLEVYVERMKREYKVEVETSPPRVSYRETITKRADFSYTHKKQTGGSGQYGKVAGWIEPITEEDFEGNYEFIDEIKVVLFLVNTSHLVTKVSNLQWKKVACLKHQWFVFVFASMTVLTTLWTLLTMHSKRLPGAWREAYEKAGPQILEPIMKVSVEGPSEFQGNIIGTINQRRGMITGTTEEEGYVMLDAEVPLSEMFGYSTTLRSNTQGKAEFTMESAKYAAVPRSVADDLVKEHLEAKQK